MFMCVFCVCSFEGLCVFVYEHNRSTDKPFIIISSLHAVLMNYADAIDLFLQHARTQMCCKPLMA